MSVEDRLRRALTTDAEALNPRVEVGLAQLRTTTRRHVRIRWAARSLAAAAAVAVVGVIGYQELIMRTEPPVVVDPSRQDRWDEIAGEYAVLVPPSDSSRQLGLVGRWEVTIHSDGRLDLEAPSGSVDGVSGGSLRISGDQVVTNALSSAPGCQSGTGTGSYKWRVVGVGLDFTEVGEDCAARAALFADAEWRRIE